MPRKKLSPEIKKLLIESSKRGLRDWAEQVCKLFNNPIEYLKDYCPESAWPKVAKNKERQQKFAEAVQEVGQRLKQAIMAAEKFFEIRSKVDDQRWQRKIQDWSDRLKAIHDIHDLSKRHQLLKELTETDPAYAALQNLQDALAQVNNIPSASVLYHINASNQGEINRELLGFKLNKAACENYQPAEWEVCWAIESFKDNFARYKEHFPIGVCRYEKCQKLFVKERKDERYCSRTHKKLAWKRKAATKLR